MTNRSTIFRAALIVAIASACGGGESTEPDTTVALVAISGQSTIAPGATSQLTATPRNAAGTALAGLTATWSSSATAVASVSNTGLVTAGTAGTATITATVSGVAGTRLITVQTINVTPNATVTVSGSAFSPPQVDISAGGTVTWNFTDIIEHNVTFSGGGASNNIGNTSSGSVARTFATAGTFPYNCTIHAGMTGTVVVH